MATFLHDLTDTSWALLVRRYEIALVQVDGMDVAWPCVANLRYAL
jgi:hypothetical protein